MIQQSIESLRIWSETIRNFTKKISDRKGNVGVVAKQKPLLVLIFKILCIHVSNSMQIKDCVISTSSLVKLDDLINETKLKVIKILNILATYVFEAIQVGDKSNVAFIELMGKVLPLMLSSLLQFCKSDKIDISALLGVR